MPVADKAFIRKAFDSITPRYDLLNQILSFGMSKSWRERSAEIVLQLPGFAPKTVLDLGCGTGKFLEVFLHKKAWESATGLDFSAAMLARARSTVAGNVMWLQGDFDALPFLEDSFDLVISGFTLRSVQRLPEFLANVRRIVTPGGRVAFLDLTRPRNSLARFFFYPYLRFILPILGGLISGNREAYRFLSSSIQGFQSPDATLRLMESLGYKGCTSKSFAFGAATLIIGSK